MVPDLINIIAPGICCGCGGTLVRNETLICTECYYHLPKTNFHKESGNMVEQMFWGRTKIENATAFYYYTKGSRVQQIIYHLKYKNQKEIGYELGKEFAYSLKGTPYEQTDLIAAVPLHIVKYKKRGYNQSYWIAKGLAEILKKPVEVNNITRKIDSFTQTHKSRYERWENLSDGFFVRNVEPFRNKHILLIDDVITTGATLEACVNTLLSIPGTRISIAVLAIATN